MLELAFQSTMPKSIPTFLTPPTFIAELEFEFYFIVAALFVLPGVMKLSLSKATCYFRVLVFGFISTEIEMFPYFDVCNFFSGDTTN